jgi:DNA-binding transcriptional LysR family regulator
MSDRLVLVSGRIRGLTPLAPLSLQEVADLKLVLPSHNHFLRHTLEHHINRGDFRPVQTLEIDGQSATLQFVASSDWSTILPSIALVREFESQRFTINPIREPELRTEIYALHSSKHRLNEASTRFIAMLEEDLRHAPMLPSIA